MNYGSPIFARPIATPSLSLDTSSLDSRVVASETTPRGATATSQDQTIPAVREFPPQADMFPIYYGAPRVSVMGLNVFENPAKNKMLHSVLFFPSVLSRAAAWRPPKCNRCASVGTESRCPKRARTGRLAMFRRRACTLTQTRSECELAISRSPHYGR